VIISVLPIEGFTQAQEDRLKTRGSGTVDQKWKHIYVTLFDVLDKDIPTPCKCLSVQLGVVEPVHNFDHMNDSRV